MQVGDHSHCTNLLGNTFALTGGPVTRRAVNREALLPAVEQGRSNGQRVILDEIGRAGHAACVRWRILKRKDRASDRLNRSAAGNCPRNLELRTQAISEESISL